MLTLGLLGCAKPSPVYVKSEPCRVPNYPAPVSGGRAEVCIVNGEEWVCLDGPTATKIGNYILQVDRYHDSIKACPHVVEVDLKAYTEIGNFLDKDSK